MFGCSVRVGCEMCEVGWLLGPNRKEMLVGEKVVFERIGRVRQISTNGLGEIHQRLFYSNATQDCTARLSFGVQNENSAR
jgi:hypothetical protein